MPELIYLLRIRHISEPHKANHVIALTQTGRQACLGPVVLLCPKVILWSVIKEQIHMATNEINEPVNWSYGY